MTNLFRQAMVVFMFLVSYSSFSQELPATKKSRWQHLDPEKDSIYGISMDRAYQLLKGHKKKTVIVAVIDSGIDTLHEDLRPILWSNPTDKGADEDHNGYMNDRHGWNFLGTKEKDLILRPGFEYERVYLSLKNHCSTYSDSDILRSGDADCRLWLSAKEKFQRDSASRVSGNLKFWNQIAQEDSMWRRVLGKEVYRLKDMEAYLETHPSNHNYYLPSFRGRDSIRTNLDQLAAIEEAKVQLMKKYSQDPIVYREQMIGDDYNNFNDRFYGNSFVSTSSTDANHGTHVAGIIGAVRNNKKGMDGIADAVKIMAVRAVPADADEYDKDVALAIHYAVDNGAKVINMSFGKPYSPQRAWVQEAILYAAKHDVLIVHAAGNDASNVDSVFFYPTSKLDSAGYANNVITVGASGAERANLIGSFSNYGKASVDVFAPGVQIYSSVYKNDTSKYAVYSGTSMASPVVAGLAAVLRSYYPRLSAVQVKSLIERSVTKIDGYVKMPGAGKREVTMKELCRTGGIVNAYRAVKMAAELVSRKKT